MRLEFDIFKSVTEERTITHNINNSMTQTTRTRAQQRSRDNNFSTTNS